MTAVRTSKASTMRPKLGGMPIELARLAALGAVGVAGLLALIEIGRRVTAPYELGYSEGLVLWQAMHVTSLRVLFHPISESPFVVSMYPPVYPAVVRVVATVVGDFQVGARLATAAAFGGLLACAAALVVLGVPVRYGRGARWTAAALGCGLVASVESVRGFMPAARVDGLALCLSGAGLLWFVAGTNRPVAQYGAMACFVVAAFTKQTFVAAPVACLAVLALADWKRAMRLALCYGLLGAAILLVLSLQTNGQAVLHLVHYAQGRFSAQRLFESYRAGVLDAWVPLVLAGALIVAPLWRHRSGHWWLRRLRAASRGGRPDRRVAIYLSAYLLVAMVMGMSVGRMGSGTYYFMEWNTAAGILAAMWFGRVVCARSPAVWTPVRAGLTCGLLLVFGASEAIAAVNPALRFTHGAQALDAARLDESQRAVEIMRSSPGAVLADDLTAVVKAGKDVAFEPFMMYQLAQAGLWDDAPFLRKVSAHDYAMLVVESDLASDARIPSDIRAAFASNYTLVEWVGKYRFYLPQTDRSTTRVLSGTGTPTP